MSDRRRDEVRAAGRLAGEALSGVVAVAAGVHDAVSRRVDRYLPSDAAAINAAQAGIAGGVYRVVASGTRALAHGSAFAADRAAASDAPPLTATPWGRSLLPAVTGLWGDHVAERHPALDVPMAVRVDAADVPLDPDSLRVAFPSATSAVVVFIHGLSESERSWRITPPNASGPEALPYGHRLADDLGITPVYLRYNTGLRVAENGRRLSRLLDDLVDGWPVPVTSIALVAHSMGGLVARSACHDGDRRDAVWVPLVTTLVTLGTPHHGAPLEKTVHVAEWLLRRLPETRPISRVLALRSAGIHDLRFGSLVDEDWAAHHPDDLLVDRRTDVAFLSHASPRFVAASITGDPEHPVGRVLGDGLVPYSSASGLGGSTGRVIRMDAGSHLPFAHHLSLLNHPVVYGMLREWLGEHL